MNLAATPAIVDHKRSHIVLPKGNEAQQYNGDKNIVVIRGGATSAQVNARKKDKDIPHKTVVKNIKKKVEKAPVSTTTPIKDGLLFPLPIRPLDDYHTGERKFNAPRGIRRHAGCDLYAPLGTEVRAMADGVIIQCYDFYWQTDAIEVDHGDFIARYGEIKPRTDLERNKLRGQEVKRGDVLGSVGHLIKANGEKFKYTMLHIELYGSSTSPLGVNSHLSNKNLPPFQRRSDLADPTATLDKCVMT
ncbi:M23 family metallopeptidase [Sulfurirhabdus autotrophica]|nr:M23 family metallopeptidase [Sulfurirhabdus autotrophica]